MCSDVVVVTSIGSQGPAQMRLTKNNDMIQALAADRPVFTENLIGFDDVTESPKLGNDQARPGRLGLAIQVEDPA
jgi:hypothetical protein